MVRFWLSWVIAVWMLGCWVSVLPAQDLLKQLDERLRQQLTPPSQGIPNNDPQPSSSNAESLPRPKNSSPDALPTDLFIGPSDPAVKLRLTPSPPVPATENARIVPDIPLPDQEAIPPLPQSASGYLGLVVERTVGGGVGLQVVEITDGSPAWKAGFQVGDRIVAVGGHVVTDLESFAKKLGEQPTNIPIRFLVSRNARNREVIAVLQDRSTTSRLLSPSGMSFDDRTKGKSFDQGSVVLGVLVSDLSDSFRRRFAINVFRGAAVTEVILGSPAHQAGIKTGDCIVDIESTVIQSAQDLQQWVAQAVVGQVVRISYYRGRQLLSASVVLSAASPSSTYPGLPIAPVPTSPDGTLMSPEYVIRLQSDLLQTQQQLIETQTRLRELEDRVRQLENNRRGTR